MAKTALPVVDGAGFHPEVRTAIENARVEALQPSSGVEAVIAYCRILHAHEQFKAAAVCYKRTTELDAAFFDARYLRAQSLAANGEYREAAAEFQQALRLKPDSIPAKVKLAEALFETGDTAASARLYRELAESHPDLAQAHFGIARSATGAAAIASLERAIRVFPRYGAAQFALAAAFRREGKSEQAEAALRTYERDKTTAPPLDDPLMREVEALNVGAVGLIRQAQILESQSRLAETEKLLLKAVEMDPKLAQGWVNLISLYGRLGDTSKAEEAYRRAIAVDPNRAEAHYNFGVLCFTKERWADARAAFEKAIAIDPRHPEALHNLGVLFERERRFAEAVRLYTRAIESQPDYAQAYFHLARIQVNQGRLPEAIANFEKALQPESEATPTYLYALGATQARAGHKQEAVNRLRQARQSALQHNQSDLAASITRDLRALEAQ